ncbi:kinase domain protein (macronuclear) [Tetrahymena thermophila SB210]|uniref:Kinase domain protein n=1 Tax=Tetrahymena thermophila (strain SB210) TaxID=312017 RepID=I7MCR6_TETTS|nr:kinase domain protein [Tetrahymena thermophila SB210]EAR84794.2 kinase domain protein [Tetrahymena thermophila SB210]|eukprot:XP_001032457.2 kinase domain protein [Tetrahymena thermophila SB210]
MNQSRQNLFPVPSGFHDILRELTLSILKDQPEDILFYGMTYFESKIKGNNFTYEGPKRLQISKNQQELDMYNSLFETYQFKKDQTSQNLTIVRDNSVKSNTQNRSAQIDVQKQHSQLENIFVKHQKSNDLPSEDIQNIRILENISSKQSQKSDQFKFSQQSSIPPKSIKNEQQNTEVQMVQSINLQIQDLNCIQQKDKEMLGNAIKEKNVETNYIQKQEKNLSKQKTSDDDNSTLEKKKKNESQLSHIKNQVSLQTHNQTYFTNNQNDLTLNNRNTDLTILQTFQQNHISEEQMLQNIILQDKLLFQDLNEDFKQIDIAENEVKNEEIIYGFNFMEGDDMEKSNLTIIQSNYNVQSHLKEQLLNLLAPPQEKPKEKKNLQDLVFSNQDQMKISMVESMNMGAYQKSFIYVNIMSARNLPLCMNATCEVYLEGMTDQKIVSQPVYNNNEPDWYYLRKKLILLVPKSIEKLQEDINQKPLFLCANIFELRYSKSQQQRIDLATFRVPLSPIFEKEGQWSINNYFDCQEEFQQAKLYIQVKYSLIQIQNSSLLQQQVESVEATLNPEFDKKLTKSSQKDIMASVDLNKENEKHQGIIQKLILSISNQLFKIQGTFRIVIIKARKLQHSQDSSLKVQSPLIEYCIVGDEGNITEIFDPNSKVAEEPIWFHDQDHKVDVNLGHKLILQLKLYDLQECDKSKKIYMGEINLDLGILIDQPGKWLINNYYDLHFKNNLDSLAGQVYIQSKFIPGGLEEFHQEQFGPLSQLD